MPITTQLNRSPYWADYSTAKNYYFELFQPGVSVQTRELNNLQLNFQNQIEMMGDNLFANGTIISGCNFQFYNPYPYAQLNDLDVFNNVVVPSQYLGFNVINQNGLAAQVLNYANGFQTTAPNLKTIYIKYVNTGNTGANLTAFSTGDTLTVYNPVTNPIQSVIVNNGGIGFSNTNKLIAISAIQVTQTSGTLATANGQYLNNGNGLTNVQIISVTSTNTANVFILGLAPRSVDLANSAANSQYWTFNINDALANPAATIGATVNQIIGTGLQGNVVTSSVGTITSIVLTTLGVGYTTIPFITAQSPGNAAGYNNLSLTAQNFLTQVVVAGGANTVGNGYAFGITAGVIYQKGVLINVQPQQIIVSSFNQNPSNVSVGFVTNEQIINYNLDQSLLDNANGTFNYQAPGADRLMLTPQLVVAQTANVQGNSTFLPIVLWNNGNPYIQQQQTIYNTVGAEIAQAIEDTSGDFVLLPFAVTTASPANTSLMAQTFNIIISPGEAYINGFKIATVANFNEADVNGTNTAIVNNHTISLNYGNYLVVNNVGGEFTFNTAASVSFYNQAQSWTPGQTLNPSGTLIGNAAMRSFVYNTGQIGAGAAQYFLYIFNIQMAAGYSLANVASVSYNNGSANVGVADVVLTSGANTSNIAILQDTAQDQLVFYSGVPSLKNANSVNYNYRTTNTTITVANGNTSNATITIAAPAGTTFPYGAGALSNTALLDFIVSPTGADMLYTSAVSGTVVANSSTANVLANSGTSFTANLTVGDWVYVTANSTGGHSLAQIIAIANNTWLQLNAAPSFSNGSATLTRVFPNNEIIPFGQRPRLTGNVNSNQNQVILSFGQPFTFSGTTQATVAYNIALTSQTQLTKTATRNRYISLCTSNNVGSTTGPWCLGVPDIFRLRAVYIGNSTVTNTGTNYIADFYVDPNQNSDYYGLGNLYIQQGAQPPLTTNSYMLVLFDYFVGSSGGFYDTVSYLQTSTAANVFAQDSQNLSTLSTQSYCNTWEVPEVFLNDGTEIDLLGYLDFRPYASNTVAPSTTSTGLPSLNPSNTVTLSTSGEKFFPVPNENLTCTIEGWQGRIDSIYLDQNGNFVVGTGTSLANIALLVPPIQPQGTMKIVDMVLPEYPTLPVNQGIFLTQILDTNIVTNQVFVTSRANNHLIYNLASNSAIPYNQPAVFTQYQIGQLARQIQQLQYYVTLNTLETNTASMVIPSSVNPSENRQAFGIFTDDFTTSSFTNLASPEYEALLQNGNIVPTKMLWDQQFYGIPTTPYIQFPMINQDVATGIPPQCALNLANTVAYQLLFRSASNITVGSNTDTVSITMANQATIFNSIASVSQSLTQYLTNQQYASFNNAPYATNEVNSAGIYGFIELAAAGANFSYNAASQTLTINNPSTFNENGIFKAGVLVINNIPQSTATLFQQLAQGIITPQQFAASLNVTGSAPAGGQVAGTNYYPPVAFYFYNYVNNVQYNIYQGTTLIASSNPGLGVPTAQDLTAADIALLEGQAANFWFNDSPSLYMKNFVQGSGGYVSYAGKILFNYNPTNGSQFTIITNLAQNASNFRWLLTYPINGSSVGCVPQNPIIDQSISPVYTSFSAQSWCGNGMDWNGQVTILTGFTSTWNPASYTPTTAIVPFDATQDWVA